MFLRPHLDYCDVIYHISAISNNFVSSITLSFPMENQGEVQYQAALEITGCWQGTNRAKLYDELCRGNRFLREGRSDGNLFLIAN